MQLINLYHYTRPNGGVTVSTIKPDDEYTELYRLVADEGMILTDGVTKTICVDTSDVFVWTEILDDTKIEDEMHNNMTSELTAEILEKAKAYDILMGVSE